MFQFVWTADTLMLPAVSHSPVFNECPSSSRHHSVIWMHLKQNREVVENQRGQGSKSGDGGVSILPPYGSLNGRAGRPGMTEAHNLGIDICNHSHEALASNDDSDEGVKAKRSGSSGDEIVRSPSANLPILGDGRHRHRAVDGACRGRQHQASITVPCFHGPGCCRTVLSDTLHQCSTSALRKTCHCLTPTCTKDHGIACNNRPNPLDPSLCIDRCRVACGLCCCS
ncbi:hypothetical protein BU25DRAFT_39488 [Macroventuria anomochaeta]|uniref:Uncharacterized protein n=1 Tax=Macroventuria anomochaeta TaxID=301207 RepID=A0ACB6S227_9PLEO|nr:uncharacterized protein BU25DRAFT_39488 [Macroventuria anomochaeta]KAF2628084.1 hypothetical protein BU25DRAFT_39488 [Macroventuria anomochaeta]